MVRSTLKLSLVSWVIASAFAAQAQDLPGQREAMARLSAQTGAAAVVKVDEATGAARMVRIAPAASQGSAARQTRSASERPSTDAAKHAGSQQFLRDYAGLFGIRNVTGELTPARVLKDHVGGTHLRYTQSYNGVPVFAGELRTHFDAADNMIGVSGTFVPNIDLNTTPSRSAADAANAALGMATVDARKRAAALSGGPLAASTPTLMIYREGLAKGVPGANRLVYEVQVGNGVDARDFYYVDAHTLQLVDKIAGIHEALNRRAFNAQGATQPGPNYPGNPYWVEGQAFPTGLAEADNMINASFDIYWLFKNAFGRDSFDGNGATMDSIFNRGDSCPNASWGGRYISFCAGTTTDDVTAHEWGHAYTEYTHNLIYAWQPGALNEAYSDIWGETVDRINGRGGDTPDGARTPGVCAAVVAPALYASVDPPAANAGIKNAGTAAWGPQTFSPVSAVIAGVDVGSAAAGCNALPAGSLTGKIAFIDRGTCGFSVKALNAQNAGAIGVIIGNNQGGTAVINMALTAGSVPTIPSVSISQNDGTAMKAALAAGPVTGSISRKGTPTYDNVRWLIGEDSTAFAGAIRDMYNPTCYGNPGKVSDSQYSCSTADSGGVHGNSGVPNHAYALLVDGGNYNGQSISGIGLTKAAHIYYRAQTVYQTRGTGFSGHADALEASCLDLTGVNLRDLKTGQPSGEVIGAADCGEVAKAMLAVEMRKAPSCVFTPILAKNPPAACPAGSQVMLASDSFDGGKKGGIKWTTTHSGPTDFGQTDWVVTGSLPSGRAGYGIYAANRDIGSCAPGSDATSVQMLESAPITIPAGTTTLRMAFDHWISTEATWDGGNVKISVNGGAWQLVSAANFVYNAYNGTLVTAAGGNGNPLAGQAAFTGSDGGSVLGSWGRSIINLAPYAVPGDTIKLRFDLGQDCGSGRFGWYVDDVQVYRCVVTP